MYACVRAYAGVCAMCVCMFKGVLAWDHGSEAVKTQEAAVFQGVALIVRLDQTKETAVLQDVALIIRLN